MRLLTFRTGSSTKAARIEGDVAVELPYPDVGAILVAGATEAVRQSRGPEHRLADLQLAQPVLVSPKILCVGQNYRAHIEEQRGQVPQFPTLFNKWQRTLIGPRDDVLLPAISKETDWEVELAFFIGATLRHGNEEQAQRSIAGYTIVNDVSVRDWQHHTTQFLPGKNFESTTPVGPWMVTPDELNPFNLRLRCLVDELVMQDATTADRVFSPAAIAAYVSSFTTLEPGDLIATGTPAGVGAFRKPPIYLRDGQVITSEIDGIGCLVNRCVQEVGSL
jgi:acylpyruvate hydrolase